MTEGDEELCQRCGDKGHDRRNIWMACLYDMSELGLPFRIVEPDFRKFYILRVCKNCRADWLDAIETWFKERPLKLGCGSGIFIREKGTNKEITEEEWYKRNPNREPVRTCENL